MAFTETGIEGLWVFEPRVFGDERGYFFESYNAQTFKNGGIDHVFVQDNQARSAYGVVRGLHFQHPPYAQTKLVRVLEGAILDVVVDLRSGSATCLQTFSIELTADNKKQLLVPKGFAHGYVVLSPTAEVMYKCDAFYHPAAEGGILPTDPALQIDWRIPVSDMIISGKDKELPLLSHLQNPF